MSFDVRAVRERFPALKAGYAHFDGPGGSQVPDVVADGGGRARMLAPLANRGRVTAAERAADDIVLGRPAGDGRPARRRRRAASCSAAA